MIGGYVAPTELGILIFAFYKDFSPTGFQRNLIDDSRSVCGPSNLLILIHHLHRPRGIWRLCSLHRAPEDLIQHIFGTLIGECKRQSRGDVGVFAKLRVSNPRYLAKYDE